VKATEVTAGLAESNVSLMPGLRRDSLHVTCGLTACTPGSVPGPTLGNEYGKTLPFLEVNNDHILLTDYCWIIHISSQKGITNLDMTEARDSEWQSQSLIASNSEIRYNHNVYQNYLLFSFKQAFFHISNLLQPISVQTERINP